MEVLAGVWNELPIFRRRIAMGRFGIPRHLYKFRFPPDLKDDESKDRLKAILLRNELHAAHAESLNDPFDCTTDYLVEKDSEELIDELKSGFYPEITDGCERAWNSRSRLATLRRILGLWNRSTYSNTSVFAASSVRYFVR